MKRILGFAFCLMMLLSGCEWLEDSAGSVALESKTSTITPHAVSTVQVATTTTTTSTTKTIITTTSTSKVTPTTTTKATTTTTTTTKATTATTSTAKATTTTIPTTTVLTYPSYTLHKDHLSGWEVTVDGKLVTVSVIADESGWKYVSLVPLLNSLEGVNRIVWENDSQATIYRTPISDSKFCAGEKFSLDIQRGELYQLIPPRDNWNIMQIHLAGETEDESTASRNVKGYIVRGNELFVDTHVLQMVGMSFDFRHKFLWEEQRMEIITRAK